MALINAITASTCSFSKSEIDIIVADAKLAIDDVMNPQEKIEKEHVDAVIALINAIPAEISYTKECSDAINSAMEAFASLTDAERIKLPEDKSNALYSAYATLSALDLGNFKTLSLAEINTVNSNLYRDLQKSAVVELKQQASEAINNAANKADIQAIVDDFFATIKDVPTDVQLTAQELVQAKVDAKVQLDTIDLNEYSQSERAIVEEIIANGKVAIDQCQTMEELNTLFNKIMNVVNGVQTTNQADMARKQLVQRTTIIVSVSIGSILLVLGVGLSIFFIRRRKLSK